MTDEPFRAAEQIDARPSFDEGFARRSARYLRRHGYRRERIIQALQRELKLDAAQAKKAASAALG